ncbi:D-lyxose/D-mannose family sugar isomerase [Shimia ponticola]|uniref:D-lyxose/D-mannose family sugar isomerase n=1 Tax=Shimia ponticola TaxID=2582893 RepID=UPI0011BDB8EE|nr:D-lyxose/D-mannose family sugar isomerase [Shimia ponticola]
MDRSTVNEIIAESDAFIRSHGVHLPPFAYLSPDELKAHVANAPMIRDHFLGWDITDYGQGKFEELGLFLFTTRNGSQANIAAGGGMLYAEKVMISGERQISPMHRHITKTEDIINRGGGDLVLELFTDNGEGQIDDSLPVEVLSDGRKVTMKGGELLRLKPGESVTLEPHTWHAFWGEGGPVLIVEVSNVNDDRIDNIFREPIGRFSDVTEDEAPKHLLVSDYDTWLS